MKLAILFFVLQPVVKIDRATRYFPSSTQCEGNYLVTADGSFIDTIKLRKKKIRWISLSRDLIKDDYRHQNYPVKGHWRGLFRFGDTIVVKSISMPHVNGKWVVHDCMNSRYKMAVDFLSYESLGVVKDLMIFKK